MSHEGTEVAVNDTDPYAGQWEAAAATFIDDRVAIKSVIPSIRKLADWSFAQQDEFAEIADKEFLPKIKKARGHNREMLQEAYQSMVEDPAPMLAITTAYSVFVTDGDTLEQLAAGVQA